MRSFARAWLLGYRGRDLVDAFRNAAGYRSMEMRQSLAEVATDLSMPASVYSERFAELIPATWTSVEGIIPTYKSVVFLYLSAVDWNYRRQRPQHMAAAIAAHGYGVCYVSTVFDEGEGEPRFRVLNGLADGLVEVGLVFRNSGSGSIHYDPDHAACLGAGMALKALCEAVSGEVVVVVDHPAWYPMLAALRGVSRIVYDCIDVIGAFPNTSSNLLKNEMMLIKEADTVLASSRCIGEFVERSRSAVVVPNGVEFRRFNAVAYEAPSSSQVEILYFGAISHWFDEALVRRVAERFSSWRFTLIGEADSNVVKCLKMVENIDLVGEVHYEELPRYLARASAAIIPFKINSLTRGVNPVKVYEYLAAGRPVVSTPLPELVGNPHVLTARGVNEFSEALSRCVSSDLSSARLERSRWAAEQDWGVRAKSLLSAVLDADTKGN